MLNALSAQIVLATPAPTSHRTAEENLGLGYLASVLRKHGHRVEIIDGWLEGLSPSELAERILAVENPIWLGFSCYRSNMARAIETVECLRATGSALPVIAGGFGPTFFAEQFIRSGFDVVVRGEAEHAVLELTRYFCEGSPVLEDIPGLTFSRACQIVNTGPPQQADDLDALPLPARDTLPLALRRRSAIHILTSRGCAAHCLFCSIVSFAQLSRGPNWRQRSIHGIVDELEALVQQGARCFKVIDDSLIEPPRDAKWCSQFAQEIERRNLLVRLRGSIRSDRVTRNVLAELRRVGFYAFSCGIESFSPTALQRMAKTARLEDNLRALDLFAEYDMLIQAGHILFDHETTLVELRENLEGMRRYRWTVSKGIFTEMFAAEGTPFTRLLEKRGRLKSKGTQMENHSYLVADPKARSIYRALKHWHMAHMTTYDKAIDAISAPKDVDGSALTEFHRLSVRLRERDLDLFAELLNRCEGGESEEELMLYVETEIDGWSIWYKAIDAEVDRAYADSGLCYDAEPNPFVV
jgi:anaerobic magnesium-protoporphyrin IX monomethyl ester cyclase